MPDWLCEPPLSFDDVLKPPPYLLASLQQAFDDYAYDHAPPTYEHSVGVASTAPSAAPSTHRQSLMGESIWEDDDDELGGSTEDADDERDTEGDVDGESEYSESEAASDGQSTLLRSAGRNLPTLPSTSTSTPTPPDATDQSYRARPLPPVPSRPHIPPPAYHLLHLQHLMGAPEGMSDPYSDLAACLAALDAQLLLAPFTAFAELCYEDSVRGDTSPPVLRPFSPPPLPSITHSSSSAAGDSDNEDDDLLRSPVQTLSSPVAPPLIWDARMEESSRSRGFIPLSAPRGTYPTMSQDDLTTPTADSSKHRHLRFVSGICSASLGYRR